MKRQHNQTDKIFFVIFSFIIAFFAGNVLFFSNAQAAITKEIDYQGQLMASTSDAIANDCYNITFRLYTASSSATSTALWSEDRTGTDCVNITRGLFSVKLGSLSSLNGVNFNQPLYLGVQVNGPTSTPTVDAEMTPRRQIGSVPSAFVADHAITASTSDIALLANSLLGFNFADYLRANTSTTLAASSSNTLLTINQTGSGNLIDIQQNSSSYFTIASNGNITFGNDGMLFNAGSKSLSIGTTTNNGYALNVLGNTYVTGNATTTGNFDVLGATTLASLNVNGNVAFAALLQVIGTSTLATTTIADLTVSGSSNLATTTMSGVLNVNSTGISYIMGALGIGTTSPTHKLQIEGADAALRLVGTGAYGSLAQMNFGDANNVYLKEDVDDSLTIYAANRTALMGGPVGIGTTSPSGLFTVEGSGAQMYLKNTASTSYASFRVYNDQNTYGRALNLDYTGSGYAGSWVTGGPVGEQGALGTTGVFPLVLYTQDTARMTILGNGNVGIGTATPSGDLTVEGLQPNVIVRSSSSTLWSAFRMFNDQNDPNRALEMDYSGSTFSGSLIPGAPAGEIAAIGTTGNYPLVFYASNSASMTMLPDGNIGVGTAAPTGLFQVDQANTGRGTITIANNDTLGAGTADVTIASPLVTGSSTAFDNDFQIGDRIKIGGVLRTVTSIASSTELTVDSPWSITAPGATYYAVTANVVGTGTQFVNTFKPGQTITANGETRTILSITNNTAMTTTGWDNTAGGTYTLNGGSRFSVFGNGNVAIGTSTQDSMPLNTNLTVFGEKTASLNVRGTASSNGIYSTMSLSSQGRAGTDTSWTMTNIDLGGQNELAFLYFENGPNPVAFPMWMASTSVGINTMMPTAALDITGSGSSPLLRVRQSNNALVFDINASGDINGTGNFTNSGNITTAGNITATGYANITGNITTAGTITATGSVSTLGNITAAGYANITGNITTAGTVTATGTVSTAASFKTDNGLYLKDRDTTISNVSGYGAIYNNSITMGDGNDLYNSLLLHASGTNNSVVFTDSSLANPKTVTTAGAVVISTSTSKFGVGSLAFSSSTSNDYLNIPSGADLNFGAGDWTIDFWHKGASSTDWQVVYASDDSGQYKGAMVYVRPMGMGYDGHMAVHLISPATTTWPDIAYDMDMGPVSASTFTHFAVVRNGTTISTYNNGNFVISTTTGASTAITSSTGSATIGAYVAAGGGIKQAFLTGYLDEFRISKGIARWTGAFSGALPVGEYGTGFTPTYNLAFKDSSGSEKIFTTFIKDSVGLSNIYYASGNVSIGTSSAASLLTVGGTAGSQFLVNGAGVVTGGTYNGQTISSAANLTGTLSVAATTTILGNVGIGTANPLARLSIVATGTTTPVLSIAHPDGSVAMEVRTGGIGSNNIFLGTDSGINVTTSTFNTALGISSMYSLTTGQQNTAVGRQTMYYNTSGGRNAALGEQALKENTTGSYNAAFGRMSMWKTTTGSNNSAFGSDALALNIIGSDNVAIGSSAMYNATSSSNNIAIGANAMFGDLASNYNIAIGVNAMYNNTTSTNNTAIGYESMKLNATGSYNNALGFKSLYSNTTGDYNTAIGWEAAYNNATGTRNVALGYNALWSNLASRNTAIGNNALYSNTLGATNTAMGWNAGRNNTIGTGATFIGGNAGVGEDTTSNETSVIDDYVTFLGYNATRDSSVASTSKLTNATAIGAYAKVGASNSIVLGGTGAYAVNVGIGTTTPLYKLDVNGDVNIAIGSSYKQAGTDILNASTTVHGLNVGIYAGRYLNASSSDNTAIGYGALKTSTSSIYNTVVGSNALSNDTAGGYNTVVGSNAMAFNTTGNYNDAYGFVALYRNTTGRNNAAYGIGSLQYNTTGDYNAAMGSNVLASSVSGSYNTAIGVNAGYGTSTAVDEQSTVDSFMTFIGSYASRASSTASTTPLTNGTAIGYNAKVGGSNMIILGGIGADAVNVGIGTTSPVATLSVNGTVVVTGQTTLSNVSSTNLTISGNSYLGTVQSGTWNGSIITPTYGGLGFNASSSAPKGSLIIGLGGGLLGTTTVGSTTQTQLLISSSTSATGVAWAAVTSIIPAGYWLASGTATYFNTGNVGIGTANPGLGAVGQGGSGATKILEVNDSESALIVRSTNPAANANIVLSTLNALAKDVVLQSDTNGNFKIYQYSNAATNFYLANNGRLGLGGATVPNSTLDLNGGSLTIGGVGNTGEIDFLHKLVTDDGGVGINMLDHNGGTLDGLGLWGADGISFHTGLTSPAERMRITEGGNVGIGVTNSANVKATLTVIGSLCVGSSTGSCLGTYQAGTIYASSTSITGADYAEYFYTKNTDLAAGEAVCLDTEISNAVTICRRAEDPNIMGIVSTHPSVVGNSRPETNNNANYVIVGMIGQVPAKVSAENGAINIGDSLTSAGSIPGYLMKANAGDSTVGVALENLTSGTGKIQVLISRRNKSLAAEQVEQSVIDSISTSYLQNEVSRILNTVLTDPNTNTAVRNIADEQIAKFNAGVTVKFDNVNSSLSSVNSDLGTINTRVAGLENQFAGLGGRTLTDYFTFSTTTVGAIKLGNAVNHLATEIAMVEISASTTKPALAVVQTGSGDIATFKDKDGAAVVNIGADGWMEIHGKQLVTGLVKLGNNATKDSTDMAIVDIAANSTSTALVVTQAGDGNIASFKDKNDESILEVNNGGWVSIKGKQMVKGTVKLGNNITSSTEPEVAIVEVAANATTTAFVVSQAGTGDIITLNNSDNVAVMNVANDGEVKVVGDLVVDGRVLVCAGGVCPTELSDATDASFGDFGAEGKVIADSFENYCAPGYVWVPGSSKYGTMPGFCVMGDKASRDVNSIPSAKKTGVTWTNISQGEAQLACQAIGSRYHLMSDNEWLTIAENILSVPENDSDQSQVGVQLATSSVDAISYKLSNGKTIASLVAANAYEWTDQMIKPNLAGEALSPASMDPMEYFDVADFRGLNSIIPPYYLTSSNGIGKIKTGAKDDSLRGFVRGLEGVYGLDLSVTPNTSRADIGFRCAR